MTKETKCVRCANGDTRTADGFHLMSTGKYKRCADLPPYDQPAPPPSKQRPFSLWSFLRDVLSQGATIQLDYRQGARQYEEFSARLDEAAREREAELRAQLSRGAQPVETTPELLKAALSVEMEHIQRLETALRNLICAARTSGGVAGRDDYLMHYCQQAELVLNYEYKSSAVEPTATQVNNASEPLGRPRIPVGGSGASPLAGHPDDWPSDDQVADAENSRLAEKASGGHK